MFLCFLNANSQPIQPDIKVEYREYSTKILMPTFNPISEENERFVNSKELVPAAQAQFEEYLGFCLNKVNNWEELRESFINRRLAIINWEDDQPNYLWVWFPFN